MRRSLRLACLVCLVGLLQARTGGGPHAATSDPRRVLATSAAETGMWRERLDGLVRSGALALRKSRADTLLPGRQHARYAQTVGGVPVIGADLVVQMQGADVVSVFGTLYDGVRADTVPALDAEHALRIAERVSGQPLGRIEPDLGLLPLASGAFALVYTVPVFSEVGRVVYEIDAQTGEVVEARPETETQSAAVGHGKGLLGDDKKMSVRAGSGQFLGDDLLRPPLLQTVDTKGSLDRVFQVLNALIPVADSDLIADADDDWTDPVAVDGHAYAGYTYDFYFKRFGRRGLDGNDLHVRSIVHPVRLQDFALYTPDIWNFYYANAFYAGGGVILLGEGLPAGVTLGGQHFTPFAGALDVVAHELTHGVTQYTSNLLYQGESGALNESFSDMMGTSAEFFFQPAGNGPLKADYLLGEDITQPGAVRAMDDPARTGNPDHYSNLYRGPNDGGGVHVNATIPDHVYYLAIEGGRNRTSGLAVQGVGAANREQIEKTMYRAFTLMMPSAASFSVARAVTVQSARDLYGAGSAAERALTEAWTAVGVQ